MSVVKTLAVSAALALGLTAVQPQPAQANHGRWIAGVALGAVATGLLLGAHRRQHYHYRVSHHSHCHWHHRYSHCHGHSQGHH